MEIGGIPIIAHPERYEAIWEDCLLRNGACVQKAAEMGALFQVNKGSLMGKHGVKSLHTAVWMLEQGMILSAHCVTEGCYRTISKSRGIVEGNSRFHRKESNVVMYSSYSIIRIAAFLYTTKKENEQPV